MTLRVSTIATALAAALAAGCGGGSSSSDPGPCAGGIDDGNACTVDGCDAAGVPTHVPVDADDGDPCTDDSCDPTTGVLTYVPVDLADGDACTADSCDPASGVSHVAVDPDDGNACTADACDPATGVSNEPVSADDGVACTVDSCDPATGVAHVPDHAACGTGQICDPAAGCITAPVVDQCMLDFPFVVSVATGALTEILRGDVWSTGVTEADGPSPLVHAEVGYGPAGSDPRNVAWTWGTAGYGEQEPGRDEYHERILAPLVAGTYAFTFRFAIEGGSWAYCDDDGASQAQDDFDPLMVGRMTVVP